MKKTDLAYLAGIIDGEGTITFHKGKSPKGGLITYDPFIAVFLTVGYIPTLLHFTFGGSLQVRWKGQIPPRYKQQWVWQAVGTNAYNCLKTLLPYLIIKRPQAEVAIKLYESHPKYKHLTLMERQVQSILAEKIKQLNK